MRVVARVGTLSLLWLATACASSVGVAPDGDLHDAVIVQHDSANSTSTVPTRVMATSIATYVVDAQGRTWAWGFLHHMAHTYVVTPTRVAALDGVRVVRDYGGVMTCGLFADRSLRCSMGEHPFVAVPWATDVADFSMDGESNRICVLQTSGTVDCSMPLMHYWAARELRYEGPVATITHATQLACDGAFCCAVERGEGLTCWGRDVATPGFDALDPQPPTHLQGSERVVEFVISGNSRLRCARLDTGQVRCWGMYAQTPLGIPEITDDPGHRFHCRDPLVDEVTWHPCIRWDGSVVDELDNTRFDHDSRSLVFRTPVGALIEGPRQPHLDALEPVIVDSLRPAGLQRLQGIAGETPFAMGDGHVCWIAGSALYCAGDNFAGQLGTGDRDNVRHTSPSRVVLP